MQIKADSKVAAPASALVTRDVTGEGGGKGCQVKGAVAEAEAKAAGMTGGWENVANAD